MEYSICPLLPKGHKEIEQVGRKLLNMSLVAGDRSCCKRLDRLV
jgi:hypothetical protein